MNITVTKTVSIVFLIAYSVASTIGSIFLVTWGGTSSYKKIMVYLRTHPINWFNLVDDSILWLPVNMAFWTVLVFLITAILEVSLKAMRKS